MPGDRIPRLHPRRTIVRAFLPITVLTGLLLAPLAVLPAAQGNPEAAKLKNPVASTPESIAAGQAAFKRYCANCHGLNGEGSPGNDLTPAAPDLTDKEWKHGSSDGEIFTVIKVGVGPSFDMAPW